MDAKISKLSIYCKSYGNDVLLAKNLLDSINKFNVDKIPFYISVPEKDIELFKTKLGTEGYTLLKDEDIDSENTGWKGQQIVKSQFWKLELCENYLCIDSDCFFIRPFYLSDFMYDENTPYTICHEYKSFFEFVQKHPFISSKEPMNFDPMDSFVKERLHIMSLFGRTGVVYDFGPGPTIWSCKVWKSLFENYIKYNNITFADLIQINGSEFTWYGEWLLYSEEIKLIPRGPLFKNYHYPYQYEYDKNHGYTLDKLSKLYLGVGIQSIYNFNL
jgi:hypothetical protein